MKSTKKSLLLSALSLMMCVAMLIGTTYAWFTDSVTSGKNKIVAGNLDVELEYTTNGTDWTPVTDQTKLFDDSALWEPGHTEVAYLRLSNAGTLALKYNLAINVANEVAGTNVAGESLKLSDYINMGVVEDWNGTVYADRDAARTAVTGAGVIANYAVAGEMAAGAAAETLAIVVYMPEEVGNEANYKTGTVAPSIELGVTLVATQDTVEADSFDNTYDANAQFPTVANTFTPATVAEVFDDIAAAEEGDVIVLPEVNDVVDLTGKTVNDLTIKGNDDVTVKVSTGGAAPSVNADGVVFDGVTFDFGNQTYNAIRGTVTYKNCTFNGLVNSYDNSTFVNCTFTNGANQYQAHVYAGTATFTGCTFNGDNRCVYIYTDGGNASATFTDCTFTMTGTPDKSAIMLNSRNNGENYTVVINNCTQTGGNAQGTASADGPNYDYRGIFGLKHNPAQVKGTVTVDGTVVYNN